MKIFIVGGKSGSGKGEVAKMIQEFYTYKLKKVVITSFAKYLKNFAVELTDWDGISVDKPRDFFQKFGDKIRAYDKYFFTKRMVEDIHMYERDADVVVINDARMPEEFEELAENFDDVTSFLVVNQFAPSKLTVAQQAHITETSLENYNDIDYIIANDDIKATKDKVFKILEGLEK